MLNFREKTQESFLLLFGHGRWWKWNCFLKIPSLTQSHNQAVAFKFLESWVFENPLERHYPIKPDNNLDYNYSNYSDCTYLIGGNAKSRKSFMAEASFKPITAVNTNNYVSNQIESAQGKHKSMDDSITQLLHSLHSLPFSMFTQHIKRYTKKSFDSLYFDLTGREKRVSDGSQSKSQFAACILSSF